MKATLFAYPAAFQKGPDGRLTVTFRDLPEALTDGATEDEALENAADALSEALMARIADGEEILLPTAVRRGELQVAPDPTIAAKAALHQVAREERVTAAELARRLGTDHKEARRMLAPDHRTKIPRLADALGTMGHQVTITVTRQSDRVQLVGKNTQTMKRSAGGTVAAKRKRATPRKRA